MTAGTLAAGAVAPALRVATFSQRAVAFAVLAEKTARTRLTYRLSTLLALLASGVAYSVILLVWLEVYRRNPNPGPLPLPKMLAYLVTAFVTSEIMSLAVDFRVLLRVRMGLIATDVIRPLGFVTFQMAQAVGDLFVNVLFALPIFGVGLWFIGGGLLPPSVGSAALGIVSGALAFFVAFGVTFLIVQAIFVLHSGYGVITAKVALHQVFSGLSAPLVMFPEALRNVAVWLPFRHVIETPVSIWLGQARAVEIPRLLLGQALWGLALVGTGSLLFGAVMRRHQVQGG
jgi:ABC-2 type transport system permease protein